MNTDTDLRFHTAEQLAELASLTAKTMATTLDNWVHGFAAHLLDQAAAELAARG